MYAAGWRQRLLESQESNYVPVPAQCLGKLGNCLRPPIK
jgi:hypothetical protein